VALPESLPEGLGELLELVLCDEVPEPVLLVLLLLVRVSAAVPLGLLVCGGLPVSELLCVPEEELVAEELGETVGELLTVALLVGVPVPLPEVLGEAEEQAAAPAAEEVPAGQARQEASLEAPRALLAVPAGHALADALPPARDALDIV
jgi:hypothetical protein